MTPQFGLYVRNEQVRVASGPGRSSAAVKQSMPQLVGKLAPGERFNETRSRRSASHVTLQLRFFAEEE